MQNRCGIAFSKGKLWDLSIHGPQYPQQVLEPIPHRCQKMTNDYNIIIIYIVRHGIKHQKRALIPESLFALVLLGFLNVVVVCLCVLRERGIFLSSLRPCSLHQADRREEREII